MSDNSSLYYFYSESASNTNIVNSAVSEVTIQGLTNNLNMNGFLINNVGVPVLAQDAANKQYVDGKIAGSATSLDITNANYPLAGPLDFTLAGTNTQPVLCNDIAPQPGSKQVINAESVYAVTYPLQTAVATLQNASLADISNTTASTGPITASAQRIINVADATGPTDAMNQEASDARYYINTTTLDQIQHPTTFVSMNSQLLRSVANGISNQDAVTVFQLNQKAQQIENVPINLLGLCAGDLNVNSHKIINLNPGSTSTDAVNYAQLQAVAAMSLNTIASLNPTSSAVSLNNNQLTEVAPATLATHGVNLLQMQSETLGSTYTLADISNLNPSVGAISASGQVIQNSAEADPLDPFYLTTLTSVEYINHQYFLNQATADANYLPKLTTTLTDILSPTAPYSFGSQRLTDLATPTQNADAATKAYVDSSTGGGLPSTASLAYISATNPSITAITASGMQINDLADPYTDTDAMTLGYCTANFLAKGSTYLNQIGVPTSSFSFNSQKLRDIDNAVLPQDATPLHQVQELINASAGSYMLADSSLQTIASANPSVAAITASSQKIINLGDATTATDALNRQTADARYYLATTPLNSLTRPTADMVFNLVKLVNIAPGIGANDATSLGQVNSLISTAGANYMPSTQTLNGISNLNSCSAPINMALQKISNMDNPTLAQDAVTLSYLQLNNYTKTQSDARYRLQSTPITTIQSTDTTSTIACANSNVINIQLNSASISQPLMKLFVPAGQPSTPLGIQSFDKIQFLSGLGSASFNNSGAGNGMGLYIQSPYIGPSVSCYTQIQCALTGASTAPQLTMSSSYAVGAGFGSALYNQANTSGASSQQNLLISAGTPTTDNTYYCWGDYMAGAFPIQNQFNRAAGYTTSPAVSITQGTQFTSKNYVDTALNSYVLTSYANANYMQRTDSLATISARNLNGANVVMNGYQLTGLPLTPSVASDAVCWNYTENRYLSTSSRLNQLSAPNANYGMAGFKLTGLGAGTANGDSVRYEQVIGQFYPITTPLQSITIPTGWLNMNSNGIYNCANPSNGTDVMNKQYADGNYLPQTTRLNNLTANGDVQMNGWNFTNLGAPVTSAQAVRLNEFQLMQDGINQLQQLDEAILATTQIRTIITQTMPGNNGTLAIIANASSAQFNTVVNSNFSGLSAVISPAYNAQGSIVYNDISSALTTIINTSYNNIQYATGQPSINSFKIKLRGEIIVQAFRNSSIVNDDLITLLGISTVAIVNSTYGESNGFASYTSALGLSSQSINIQENSTAAANASYIYPLVFESLPISINQRFTTGLAINVGGSGNYIINTINAKLTLVLTTNTV